MAKLRITSDALLLALFPDHDGLMLRDIGIDIVDGWVVLDLAGVAVPDVQEIVAEVRVVSTRSTVFLPRASRS